jgi:hypothetical protein
MFHAPDTERMRELGLDPRAAAAAERAGLLRRLPGNVLLAPDAPRQAAQIDAASGYSAAGMARPRGNHPAAGRRPQDHA